MAATQPLTLRRVASGDIPGVQSAKWLNAMIFEGEYFEAPKKGNVYWLARDPNFHSYPVGFCSIRPLTNEPTCLFLSRAGVLKHWRGKGLQQRMIRARLAWARKQGKYEEVLTYAAHDNHSSIASLIKAGMKLYTPENPWGTPHSLHFRMDI